MDRPSDLAFFAVLAHAGSLSAAARELNVTPPAVSKRLANIERRLGVRLLNRTTRSTSLTDEGEIYFRHARRILEDIDQLEKLIARRAVEPSGLLRVNATLGFGRWWIAPAIAGFVRQHPEVSVQLDLTARPRNLTEDAFDLGIRFGEPREASAIIRKVAENRRFICAAPAYLRAHGRPAVPHDLSGHNCIILRQDDAPFGLWQFTKGRHTETVRVQGSLSSNDGQVVLNWALDGLGVVMRAGWDIAEHLKSGRLELLLEEYPLPAADIFAVYPERNHLSAKVRAFVDYLVVHFGDLPSIASRDTPVGVDHADISTT